MSETYQKFMKILTATNVIGFLLIEGYYIPCLIVVWFMYSYTYEQKGIRIIFGEPIEYYYLNHTPHS